MDVTWVDALVFGLVVALVASLFFRFKLPTDPTPRGKRPKPKDIFGRLHLDDLKMPEATKPEDTAAKPGEDGKPAARKTATWDPERLKLGTGHEGAAKLAAIDPSFDEATFLETARAQFNRYTEAWNARDETALSAMCTPALAAKCIRHWQNGNWSPIWVEEIESAALTHTRTAGRTAIATVRFVARVREGKAAAAVPKRLEQSWVLARPFYGDDPTWEIQTITTGVDA